MSLVDFMQQLQDQDNIVYSEAPEPSIRVIPPEKSCTKIIPPENTTITPPTTIKLKIRQKNVEIKQETPIQVEEPTIKTVEKPPSSNTETVQQSAIDTQSSIQPTVNNKELNEEELFISTGTELSKKSIWLDYYEKAKRSRKSNPIADRMKTGRFTITPDNKVLLLPDYDIVGKDPDDVLKDKWF